MTHKKSDDTTISAETYAFADNGNMTSKTVDSVTTTYTYDDIDQLTGESRTGYACTYTYDANGNRLTKVLNGTTESYTYDDADKLTGADVSKATLTNLKTREVTAKPVPINPVTDRRGITRSSQSSGLR